MRLFKEALILLACLTAPLYVCYLGIDRPYDAIPDQDLLWASEALRILRGVAPSYADHPGALWTLIYTFNIKAVQALHNTAILDELGNISEIGTRRIIGIARIENALLCGTCAYLVYQTSLTLRGGKWLSLATGLLTSTSGALLIGVSEIRHEIASIAFILLSIICYQKALSSIGTQRKIFAALATLAPIVAAFCKNQVLILTPLLAASTAYIYFQEKRVDNKQMQIPLPLNRRLAATWGGYAALTWFIVAAPDIDLINLPFWVTINLTLVAILSTAIQEDFNPKFTQKAFLANGLIQIAIFKILSPGWWRQAITGFPSWMFRYANSAEDPNTNLFGQILQGGSLYLSHSFPPQSISSIAIVTSVFASIALIYEFLRRKAKGPGLDNALNSLGWLSSAVVIIILSQRIAPRYEAYFYIPYILLAAKNLGFITHFTYGSWTSRMCARSLQLTSAIIIFSSACGSAKNLGNLQSFVNPGQGRDFLCIWHHMDKSMKNTSAGTCAEFPQAIIDKNVYDSWNGPN